MADRWPLMPSAPRRQPNTVDQRRILRADLHRYVDACLDRWELIERQAAEMGAGYPPSTMGGGTGSGSDTLVESQAFQSGPGEAAVEWLAEWAEARGLLANVYSDSVRLLPLSDVEKARAQERQNSVELCTKCGLPAPKVRRIDGAPYHADTCYFQERRANIKIDARNCADPNTGDVA